MKKELKDEITHILYDQTRRTPIVIPVINEIGGGGQPRDRDTRPAAEPSRNSYVIPKPSFPAPVVPDSEAIEPKLKSDTRGY